MNLADLTDEELDEAIRLATTAPTADVQENGQVEMPDVMSTASSAAAPDTQPDAVSIPHGGEYGRVDEQYRDIRPSDFADNPEMTGAEAAGLNVQSNTGMVSEHDGTFLGGMKALWQSFAQNSSGKLTASNVNKWQQIAARGFDEDADGRIRPLYDMSDEEQNYIVDSMGANGAARYFGSFLGLSGVGSRGEDDLMRQWDETDGVRIADPEERRFARAKYIQDIAKAVIGEKEGLKQAAEMEQSAREESFGGELLRGLIEQGAYTLPFMVPGIGPVLAGAIEGGDRYNELRADELGMEADGNLNAKARRDDVGDAALKAGVRGAIAPTIEMVGGKVLKPVGWMLGKVPLFKTVGDKVLATRAGQAIDLWMKRMRLFGRITGMQSAPEEFVEEFEDQVIDAGLGLDRREDEKQGTTALERAAESAADFFKPENLGDLAKSMLLMQVLQSGIAYQADRYNARNYRIDVENKDADGKKSKIPTYTNLDAILSMAGVDRTELGLYTAEEKNAAVDAWVRGLTEQEIVDRFKGGAKEINRLMSAMAEAARSFDFGAAAHAKNGDVKAKFTPPTVTLGDGTPQVMWDEKVDADGSAYRSITDAESGVTVDELRDKDSGQTRYRIHDGRGRVRAAEMFDSARAYADEMADRNLERNNKLKYVDYLMNEGVLRGIDVVVADSLNDARQQLGEPMWNAITASREYREAEAKHKGVGGITLPEVDGKRRVLLVLDNIHDVVDMNKTAAHEAAIHYGLTEMRRSGEATDFLKRLSKSGMEVADKMAFDNAVRSAAEETGVDEKSVFNDEHTAEEVMAYAVEGFADRSPTAKNYVVAALREWYRDHFNRDLAFNGDEIIKMARSLYDMTGRRTGGSMTYESETNRNERERLQGEEWLAEERAAEEERQKQILTNVEAGEQIQHAATAEGLLSADEAAAQEIERNANPSRRPQLGYDPTQTSNGPIVTPQTEADAWKSSANPGNAWREQVTRGAEILRQMQGGERSNPQPQTQQQEQKPQTEAGMEETATTFDKKELGDIIYYFGGDAETAKLVLDNATNEEAQDLLDAFALESNGEDGILNETLSSVAEAIRERLNPKSDEQKNQEKEESERKELKERERAEAEKLNAEVEATFAEWLKKQPGRKDSKAARDEFADVAKATQNYVKAIRKKHGRQGALTRLNHALRTAVGTDIGKRWMQKVGDGNLETALFKLNRRGALYDKATGEMSLAPFRAMAQGGGKSDAATEKAAVALRDFFAERYNRHLQAVRDKNATAYGELMEQRQKQAYENLVNKGYKDEQKTLDEYARANPESKIAEWLGRGMVVPGENDNAEIKDWWDSVVGGDRALAKFLTGGTERVGANDGGDTFSDIPGIGREDNGDVDWRSVTGWLDGLIAEREDALARAANGRGFGGEEDVRNPEDVREGWETDYADKPSWWDKDPWNMTSEEEAESEAFAARHPELMEREQSAVEREEIGRELEELGISNDEADLNFRIRTDEPPTRTGIGYKVFVQKNGKLYPPMVNPTGEDTPIGVWLDAEEGKRAADSKTGRMKVQAGGKGTNVGKSTLAYRPGWHLGKIPYALQFNKGEKVDNPYGMKNQKGEVIKVGRYFPANFVWAEVEYADDVDYQDEAMSYGKTPSGKFNHALAGLPRIPKNGSYEYRTNANPATDPWIITGAMKVNRVLSNSEVDALVREAGRDPQERENPQSNEFQPTDRYFNSTGDATANFRVAKIEMPPELSGVREALFDATEKGRYRYSEGGWFDVYDGVSLNAQGAIEEGRYPIAVWYKLVGARGDGHRMFVRQILETDNESSGRHEWHHFGESAKEVTFVQRADSDISDVTLYAMKNYRDTKDDSWKKVIEIDRDATDRLHEIFSKIVARNTTETTIPEETRDDLDGYVEGRREELDERISEAFKSHKSDYQRNRDYKAFKSSVNAVRIGFPKDASERAKRTRRIGELLANYLSNENLDEYERLRAERHALPRRVVVPGHARTDVDYDKIESEWENSADRIRTSVEAEGKILKLFGRKLIREGGIKLDVEGAKNVVSGMVNNKFPANFRISGLYTGSAADYEKPSLVKVGTGEGSQVYGWGLYASNRRGVAESYAHLPLRAADAWLKESHRRAVEKIRKIRGFSDLDEKARSTIEDFAKSKGGHSGLSSFLRRMAQFDSKRSEYADFVDAHAKEFDDALSERPASYVYEQTFFTNRAPGDESHLLKWYEPVSGWQMELLEKALGDNGVTIRRVTNGPEYNRGTYYEKDGKLLVMMNDLKAKLTGELAYQLLSKDEVLGSPKAASEWLAAHDIDGIKYPVDSYGKTVKDGDKAGWNYVSFRDDNITVDHKWVDGQMQFRVSRYTPDPALRALADQYGLTPQETADLRAKLARVGISQSRNLGPTQKEIVDAAGQGVGDFLRMFYGKGASERFGAVGDAIVRRIQDAYIDLKRAEQNVAKLDTDGKDMERSAYHAVRFAYGKASNNLREVQNRFLEPFKREMAKLGLYKDMSERNPAITKVHELFLALHGPAFNRMISERTNGDDLEGSGQTTQYWLDTLRHYGAIGNDSALLSALESGTVRFAPGSFGEKALPVMQHVYDMNAWVRDLLMRSGRLSAAQKAMWESLSPYYVPSRFDMTADQNFAESLLYGKKDIDEIHTKAYTQGESKHAFGHSGTPDDPVAFAVQQAETAILRAADNEMRTKLAELVEAHPEMGRVVDATDKSLAHTLPQVPVLGKNGKVHYVPDVNGVESKYANYVAFKRNGNLHFIVLGTEEKKADGTYLNESDRFLSMENAKLIGRAVKKESFVKADGVMGALQKFSRLFGELRTSFSPEFCISNFLADGTQAARNLHADFGAGSYKQFLHYWLPAIKTAYRLINGKLGTTTLDNYAREMAARGGMIGGFATENFKDIERNIRRDMIGYASGKVGFMNFARSIGEKVNGPIELATRIASYAVAYENYKAQGDADSLAATRAASYARDVTVDFNRKGEWTPLLNAWFVFSNANIQDMRRSGLAFAGRYGLRMGFGLFALGVVSSLLGFYQDEPDDDIEGNPSWANRKEYVKQNKLGVRVGKTFFSAPIRGISRLPYYLGHKFYEVVGGKTSAAEAAKDMAVFVANNATEPIGDAPIDSTLNPISNEGVKKLIKGALPSVLRPGYELMANESFTGAPIYRDAMPGTQQVRSEMGRESTSSLAKGTARALNWLTGGNRARRGAFDVPPEAVSHVFQWLTGSVGQDAARMANLVGDIARMDFDDVNVLKDVGNIRNIPGLRRFASGIDVNSAKFHEEQKAFEADEKVAKEMGDDANEMAALADRRAYYAPTREAKRWREELQDLSKAQKKLMKMEMQSDGETRDQLHALRMKTQALFLRRMENAPTTDERVSRADERKHTRLADRFVKKRKAEIEREERKARRNPMMR